MKKIIFCLTLLFLQSCAQIVPVNKEKPVDIDSKWLGTKYTQEGKDVDVYDMVKHIDKKNPEKNIKLKFYSMLVPSVIVSAAGGWMIGDGLITLDTETEEGESDKVTTGAILAGVSLFIFSPLIESYLENRVREYNNEHFPNHKNKKTSYLFPVIQTSSKETKYMMQNVWLF